MKYAEYYQQQIEECGVLDDGIWISNNWGWQKMTKDDWDWVKKHPNGTKNRIVYK